MSSFNSKVVLITGASSGIGAAASALFAAEGASLCLVARNSERLAQVAEQCTNAGAGEVFKIVADLERFDDIVRVIDETIEHFTRLDVLVNNAGIATLDNLQTAECKEFERIINVNVRAPLFLTQSAMPHLKKTKGNVVNVSSICACANYEKSGLTYSMSKSALDKMSKKVAQEVASFGVRINTIQPGLVRTGILGHLPQPVQDQLYEEIGSQQPLAGRALTPREAAETIVYLASERAGMITGSEVLVDGGRALKIAE